LRFEMGVDGRFLMGLIEGGCGKLERRSGVARGRLCVSLKRQMELEARFRSARKTRNI